MENGVNENQENMDVSDINFDDDFDDGAAKAKKNAKLNNHAKVKQEIEE